MSTKRIFTLVVFNTDEQWVVDLIKVQTLAEQNKGYRYTLVVIDAFSKYAWAQPIEKKTGKDVTDAFAKILKEAQGRKPQTLKTDADEELYNQTFQELLKKKYIHHFSTHGDAKASIVQRFNRTLKSKLYLYFTAANTLKYVDILPKLVNQYNRTYHRSTKTTSNNTLILEPIILPDCNHTFCKTCISRVQQNPTTSHCPLCKKPIWSSTQL